ncbi:MAG: hypothetical protein MJ106_05415 [Lentisphaeria bacterium]|nr:hypothetical protein [Lentisphaeria bacterium]
MLSLKLPLHSSEISLSAIGTRAEKRLAPLGGLMGLQCVQAADTFSADGYLLDAPELLPPKTKGFRHVVKTDLSPWISGEWARLLRYGTFAAARRGLPVFLLHGCLLDGNENGGTLLFADSGAGKSTTAVRYRAQGGSCRGDDIILCELMPDALYAYPLPTMSYYSQHWSPKLRYPFQPCVRIRQILLLQCGETEERIAPVNSLEWRARLAHSLSFHWCQYGCRFSPAMLQWTGDRLLDVVYTLSERFAPLALEAQWSGDLRHILEGKAPC